MKSLCSKLFLFLLLGSCHSMLMAQEVEILESKSSTSSIGIIAGYNRSPNFTTSSKPGFYTGVSYEKPFEEETGNSTSSIIIRGMYESMSAFFEVPGSSYPSRLPSGTVVDFKTRHTTDIEYNMATVEVMYKLNLFDSKFGFTIGPSVSIPVNATIEKRFDIIEPENAKFEKDPSIPIERYVNDDRTIITSPRSEITELHPFRFALKFGVHYELLFTRTLVVPHIGYNYGLTTTSNVDGVRLNALQAGLEVRFSL